MVLLKVIEVLYFPTFPKSYTIEQGSVTFYQKKWTLRIRFILNVLKYRAVYWRMVTAAQISACLSGASNSPFPCLPPPCSRPFHPATQSTSCSHPHALWSSEPPLFLPGSSSSHWSGRLWGPFGSGPDHSPSVGLCFFSLQLDFNTSWRGCRILAEHVRSAGLLGLGMDTWQQQVFGDRSHVATSCWWYSLKLELGAD